MSLHAYAYYHALKKTTGSEIEDGVWVMKNRRKGGRRDEGQSKKNMSCREVRWGMPLILAHLLLLGCGQGIRDRGRGGGRRG
jgi:hypothetical protein